MRERKNISVKKELMIHSPHFELQHGENRGTRRIVTNSHFCELSLLFFFSRGKIRAELLLRGS